MEEKIIVGEQDIKVGLIESFPNHPYHVLDYEDMSELVASIEANGRSHKPLGCERRLIMENLPTNLLQK